MLPNEQELLRRDLGEYLGKPVTKGALLPLDGGYSGAQNFRLKQNGKDYFVRTFPDHQGIDNRKAEVDATLLAARNGIAPMSHHHSEDYTWFVTDFLTAKHMEWEDYQNESTLERLVNKLKALHQIEGKSLRQAPTTLEKYRYHLQEALRVHAALPGELIRLENNLLAIEHPCDNPRFIHNDLNPYNIMIKGDAFFFIDWTDGGLGDPCFDLVEIALFLPEEKHGRLLELYNQDYKKRDFNQLQRHWVQRIGLFSAWAYCEAAKLSDSLHPDEWLEALEAPKMDLLTLLERILSKDMHLDGVQNFIQFSAICYQNVKDCIEEHY